MDSYREVLDQRIIDLHKLYSEKFREDPALQEEVIAALAIWKAAACVFRFVRPPVPVSSGQAFRCDPASMI